MTALCRPFRPRRRKPFSKAHVRAFEYFGGVPTRILYDNTTLAVAQDPRRWRAEEDAGLLRVAEPLSVRREVRPPGQGQRQGQSRRACRLCAAELHGADPASGQLGGVERVLVRGCRKHRQQRVRGHAETIGERFECDRSALLPLPPVAYEACEKLTTKVNSYSLVRYRTNDYSVPTRYGYREVLVKGYVHQVVIACGSEVIAHHPRSYQREDIVFDPLHYLALLEQKPRALDQAAPLAGWELPACFAQLRRLLEARLSKPGKREYIQVLRLLETFSLQEVTLAIEDALRLGTISFDAVRHLLLCRIEQRPPRLDLENWPHLPTANVRTTQAADYLALLSGPPRSAACQPGGGAMSNQPEMPTPDTPQLLLEHHLKALRLPTILREYDKVARQCAAGEGGLPALSAAPDRTGVARPRPPRHRAPHPAGQVPGGQEPGQLRLPGHPVAQQDAGAGAGPMRVSRAQGKRLCFSATAAPARPTSPWLSAWPPASAAIACASPPPRRWSAN